MSTLDRLNNIKRIANSDDLTPTEKLRTIRQGLLIGHNLSKDEIRFSMVMVIVGMLLIMFMVAMESYSANITFLSDSNARIILALAGGAMAVGFTGNINIKLHWVQASGSLAITVMIYFVDPKPIESEQLPPVSSQQEGVWLPQLFSAAYAQNVSLPVDTPSAESTAVEEIPYTYKLTYPRGVSELKSASFKLGSLIKTEESVASLKVYSKGSVFRAPVNALLYDDEFDISIKYNRLVDDKRIDVLKESITEHLSAPVNINTDNNWSGVTDVLIEIVPK